MKSLQIFSFLLFSVFLLSACSPNRASENTLEPIESNTISTPTAEPKTNNTFDNDVFSLEIPDDWTIEQRFENYSLAVVFRSPDRRIYIEVVVTEPAEPQNLDMIEAEHLSVFAKEYGEHYSMERSIINGQEVLYTTYRSIEMVDIYSSANKQRYTLKFFNLGSYSDIKYFKAAIRSFKSLGARYDINADEIIKQKMDKEALEKELETDIEEDIDYSSYKPSYLYTIEEDGYNHYGTEVDQKGTRLFKKNGDDFEYLGSTKAKLIPFSIITSKAGQDTIYFNYFLPESDAPRGGIVSFKVENYPHNNFEDLEIGSNLVSFNMEELISQDRSKILSVELMENSSGDEDKLSLIDLKENNIILIKSFDKTSQYTLQADSGFGGAYAKVRWIDNDTVEYDIYKIVDDSDEYGRVVVEFVETSTYINKS